MGKKKIISSTTRKKLYLKVSDFCFDLAKLVFAGVIVAGMMRMQFNDSAVLGSGTFALVLLLLAGTALFIKGNQRQ